MMKSVIMMLEKDKIIKGTTIVIDNTPAPKPTPSSPGWRNW